ncbi:unnamed protein product [Urochloa humidicola]
MAASAGESEEQERASLATPDAEKRKGGSNDGAPSLPDDVLRNILARLPARAAVACTAVSKHLRRLIRSPEFRSLHFRLAPPLPRPHIACVATAPIRRRPDQQEDPVSGFVGFHLAAAAGGGGGVTPMRSLAGRRYINVVYVNTCNGVVLLASEEYTAGGSRRKCILWNPAIADIVEEVAVPDPPARTSDYLTLGLGYGQRSKTYKLLLCCIDISRHGGRAVKSLASFQLGGNGMEKQPTELPAADGVQGASFSQNSLYIDGRIYVIDREKLAILAFDVDDETVASVHLPIEVSIPDLWNHTPSLMELYGRPCVATDYDGGVTLWLLSVDHQWNQRCVIWEVCWDSSYVGSVKGVWDCGGVMVVNLENRCRGGVDYLFLYDATTEETFRATLHRDLAPEWAESCVNPMLCWGYSPTLVSPSSIVGKLDQDKGTFSRDIVKALNPVVEQDKRKGLEETLDVMCFVDFLVRIMQKLPDDLQQVVEMKLMDSNNLDISFERVIFEDEDV